MASSVELGIDFNTSNIIIYQRDKGIVFDEPAVIAFNNSTQQILAIGKEAHEMIGRTPDDIVALRPLQKGIIENFDMTSELLRLAVLSSIKKKHMFSRPSAVICFPSSVNDRDKAELIRTLYDVGMRKTQVMNRAIAICLGAGIPLDSTGKLIVEISGGITDLTILTAQSIISSQNSNVFYASVSGDSFTNHIIKKLSDRYGFLVDEHTAERLKCEIGNVLELSSSTFLDVYGKNIISGLPKQMRITNADIYSAMEIPINLLCDFIQRILSDTRPEHSSDIYRNGLYLSGGGSLLSGLPAVFSDKFKIKTTISESPQYDAVLGLGYALENSREIKHYLSYINTSSSYN